MRRRGQILSKLVSDKFQRQSLRPYRWSWGSSLVFLETVFLECQPGLVRCCRKRRLDQRRREGESALYQRLLKLCSGSFDLQFKHVEANINHLEPQQFQELHALQIPRNKHFLRESLQQCGSGRMQRSRLRESAYLWKSTRQAPVNSWFELHDRQLRVGPADCFQLSKDDCPLWWSNNAPARSWLLLW